MVVYLAAKADEFPPGVTIDPTGSYFCACAPQQFYVPIYWNPTTISYEHEEFRYIVSTPMHVAALHSIPESDRGAVLAYLLAHFDKREPVEPMCLLVPDGWDPVAAGRPVPMWAAFEGKSRTRYTLSDWRKMDAEKRSVEKHGIAAMQRYYEEHYDLKEVLDAQDQLVSTVRGKEYIDVFAAPAIQSPVVATLARF
ncbi:hypothetical protein B0H12DRAFT_1170527 [Mycena haematopus]|nr:hypothetical protein B0H12DRAFT_1170527 [Mycena haematopus]